MAAPHNSHNSHYSRNSHNSHNSHNPPTPAKSKPLQTHKTQKIKEISPKMRAESKKITIFAVEKYETSATSPQDLVPRPVH